MSETSGTWIYAVVPPGDPESLGSGILAGVRGVAGEQVRILAGAAVAAVVGTVDLAQFGEESLQRRLADLDWLELAARAHHEVIAAVAEAGPALPWRFATVYRGDERVAGLLGDRGAELATTLRRLADSTEWGVKAYLEDEPADPGAGDGAGGAGGAADGADGEPDPASGPPERPGTAYLFRRRARMSAREDLSRRAQAGADEIHAVLADLADAALLYAPQDQQLSGRTGLMVLNASYLVPHSRGDDFAAAVAELADEYPVLQLELTGPWPPYSFIEPDRPAGSPEAGP